MSNISEALHDGDLKHLVKNIFEIDSFSSKLGDDNAVVVLSFTAEDKAPADDMVNFIERGYEFVLDADAAPHETDSSKYRVFVEIERSRRAPQQISEILYGLQRVTGIDDFKFRYYKSFKSMPATDELLGETIPADKNAYEIKIKENSLNNFSNFFSQSFLENIHVDDDSIEFQRMYADPVRMRILDAGRVQDVYEALEGRIMLETDAMSRVLWLTKYIGNYNITKVGDAFVFENDGFAVALK